MDYMVKHDVWLGSKLKAIRIPQGNSWCTATGTSLSTYLNPSSANNLRLHASKYLEPTCSLLPNGSDALLHACDKPDELSRDGDVSSAQTQQHPEAEGTVESDTGSEQAHEGEASIDTDHDEPISDFELEDPQEMCQGLYAIADSESDYEVVDSKTFGFLCAAFKRGELDWSTYCNAPRGKGPDKLTQPDKHAAWLNLVQSLQNEDETEVHSRRRLALYVNQDNRWTPATLQSSQRSAATLKVRDIRSGRDIVLDRNLVSGFTIGRLNTANGSEKSAFTLQPLQCACCLRRKRRRDTETDSQFCSQCREREADALPTAAAIDAFVQSGSPKARAPSAGAASAEPDSGPHPQQDDAFSTGIL
jgi:hypothetical protein